MSTVNSTPDNIIIQKRSDTIFLHSCPFSSSFPALHSLRFTAHKGFIECAGATHRHCSHFSILGYNTVKHYLECPRVSLFSLSKFSLIILLNLHFSVTFHACLRISSLWVGSRLDVCVGVRIFLDKYFLLSPSLRNLKFTP